MQMMIPIRQIASLVCRRPDAVRRYAAMLLAGEKAPPILIVKQHGRRYPYRIFDGAHRIRAAKRIGRTMIEAHIVCEDPPPHPPHPVLFPRQIRG